VGIHKPRCCRLPVGHRLPFRQDCIRRNDRIGNCWLQVYLWFAPANANSLEASPALSSACVGQFLLQYKGLEATTVSHASLIVGTLPVLLALASAVSLKEKLNASEYGLIVLSAAGAVFIATAKKTVAGPQPTMRGDLLVFLSMFAAMLMILLNKRLMEEYGACR